MEQWVRFLRPGIFHQKRSQNHNQNQTKDQIQVKTEAEVLSGVTCPDEAPPILVRASMKLHRPAEKSMCVFQLNIKPES